MKTKSLAVLLALALAIGIFAMAKLNQSLSGLQENQHQINQKLEDLENFVDMTVPKKYIGIGMMPTIMKDRIAVYGLIEGRPAERAGLKLGDTILSVDGKKMGKFAKLIHLGTIAQMIRGKGEKGTAVVLVIKRKNQAKPMKFTIIREEISLDEKIRLWQFLSED